MAIKGKNKRKNSSLQKRAKISHATKDQGGGGSRVISWKEVDGEVQFFQPTVGKNAINIIPFEIKSKNHPLVKQGQMEIGELDYCLDIWTHRNVGPSESSVICLKKTYGKACPICEEAEKLKKAEKEKEAAALTSKRRVFYNVEDTRKKPGELQVFEVSHFLFEKELIDEARNEDEGENSFIDFADPETGSIVCFRCSKTSQGGFEFNEFKSFTFAEREDPIDDDLLESAISFDKYLNILDYDEAQAILFGADEDDVGEDEKPARKKKVKNDDDNDDDEEKPEKKSIKKSAKKKKPVEEDEEEEEEEREDERDDEDEKPVKKPRKDEKSAGKGKCPHGFIYGKDADEYEECEDCDLWSKCVSAKK
jgi:hypothetical protein